MRKKRYNLEEDKADLAQCYNYVYVCSDCSVAFGSDDKETSRRHYCPNCEKKVAAGIKKSGKYSY